MTNIYTYRIGYSDSINAYASVLARNPISLIISIYCFIGLFFVLGLCGFHNYLVCTGQTTNEKLKHTYPHGSQYSNGIVNNCIKLFCTVPHTHIDTQQIYKNAKSDNPQHTTINVQYIQPEQLNQLAERAYMTNLPTNEQYNAASQTRRDSLSASQIHLRQHSNDINNNINNHNGRHTRNQSAMPIDNTMNTISEHGLPNIHQTVDNIIETRVANTPKNQLSNGSPISRRNHALNAESIVVQPTIEQSIGHVNHNQQQYNNNNINRSHQRTSSLSIVVPDVVPKEEVIERSELQSPLHERGPSLSQVTLYTPVNGYNHSQLHSRNVSSHNNQQHITSNHTRQYSQADHDVAEDNAVRERSIFQSPLQHSRNSSVSMLQQYAYNSRNQTPTHNQEQSQQHSRNTSQSSTQHNQSSPNRRTTISTHHSRNSSRQQLTPPGQSRAPFQSPESVMSVNSSRSSSHRASLSNNPLQSNHQQNNTNLPTIPDQPTDFTLL